MPEVTIIRTLRRFIRARRKRRLIACALSGARVAHLQAFLDRAPRHDMHRAYREAFLRGFKREQAALHAA